MAKSNGFLEKSCAGFAGCESAHGARANVHGQRAWAVQPARQSAGNEHGQCSLLARVRANGAAMWTLALLGLAARLKDTCSVRFALHKSLKNQRIKSYVQVSC